MAHTPGPWKLHSAGMQFSWEINQHVPDGGLWSAVVEVNANGLGSRTVKVKEAEANARLIAAAPELLRELKHLLSMWEEAIGWEKDYMDMGDSARAVIAKAEGRE